MESTEDPTELAKRHSENITQSLQAKKVAAAAWKAKQDAIAKAGFSPVTLSSCSNIDSRLLLKLTQAAVITIVVHLPSRKLSMKPNLILITFLMMAP